MPNDDIELGLTFSWKAFVRLYGPLRSFSSVLKSGTEAVSFGHDLIHTWLQPGDERRLSHPGVFIGLQSKPMKTRESGLRSLIHLAEARCD
jgi:hypothetical protein